MYFYEEGECITNLESAITRPDDFMKPDDEDKVIFFHNGCVQHVAAVETSESNDEENEEVEEENVVNESADDGEEPMVVKGDAGKFFIFIILGIFFVKHLFIKENSFLSGRMGFLEIFFL